VIEGELRADERGLPLVGCDEGAGVGGRKVGPAALMRTRLSGAAIRRVGIINVPRLYNRIRVVRYAKPLRFPYHPRGCRDVQAVARNDRVSPVGISVVCYGFPQVKVHIREIITKLLKPASCHINIIGE
jgi:hypothetical protein